MNGKRKGTGEWMSKSEAYVARTEELLKPIVEANGLTIYDVEYIREGSEWYLRAYIDKLEGVHIDDCVLVSRAMSELLDEDDLIQEGYIFEVSSPGLGRTLKKDKHFDKSLGEEVELRTYKAINKQKEFKGLLKSYDKDNITIETEEENIVFSRADVARIRLALDF